MRGPGLTLALVPLLLYDLRWVSPCVKWNHSICGFLHSVPSPKYSLIVLATSNPGKYHVSLAGKSSLNHFILILSFRHDFKRKLRSRRRSSVRMTQKFPHLDSRITPHCDGRAGECGLWSQTAKPKSETCHLLLAISVSASLPVGIRIVFSCGGIWGFSERC